MEHPQLGHHLHSLRLGHYTHYGLEKVAWYPWVGTTLLVAASSIEPPLLQNVLEARKARCYELTAFMGDVSLALQALNSNR